MLSLIRHRDSMSVMASSTSTMARCGLLGDDGGRALAFARNAIGRFCRRIDRDRCSPTRPGRLRERSWSLVPLPLPVGLLLAGFGAVPRRLRHHGREFPPAVLAAEGDRIL